MGKKMEFDKAFFQTLLYEGYYEEMSEILDWMKKHKELTKNAGEHMTAIAISYDFITSEYHSTVAKYVIASLILMFGEWSLATSTGFINDFNGAIHWLSEMLEK